MVYLQSTTVRYYLEVAVSSLFADRSGGRSAIVKEKASAGEPPLPYAEHRDVKQDKRAQDAGDCRKHLQH